MTTPPVPSDESTNADWTAAKVNAIYDHLAVWADPPSFYDVGTTYTSLTTQGDFVLVPIAVNSTDGEIGAGNAPTSYVTAGLLVDETNDRVTVDTGFHGVFLVGVDVRFGPESFSRTNADTTAKATKNGTTIETWSTFWGAGAGDTTEGVTGTFTTVDLTGGDYVDWHVNSLQTQSVQCEVQMYLVWLAGVPSL